MGMERVKPARPHLARAGVAGVVALIGTVVASTFGRRPFWDGRWTTGDIIGLCGVVLLVLAGVAAVRALARGAHVAAYEGSNGERTAPIGFVISLGGYILIVITALYALGYDPGGLLLGGAFTGIVLGIASQQTLGNLIGGLVLMIVRPFRVGEYVYLRGGTVGGEFEGLVTELSPFYVHLQTARGPVALPNAGVLACAVGPGARTKEEPEDEEADAGDPEADPKAERREADPGPAHGGTTSGGTSGA